MKEENLSILDRVTWNVCVCVCVSFFPLLCCAWLKYTKIRMLCCSGFVFSVLTIDHRDQQCIVRFSSAYKSTKIRATIQHKFAARPLSTVNIAAAEKKKSYCCHVLLVTFSSFNIEEQTTQCIDVQSCSAQNFEFRMHEKRKKKKAKMDLEEKERERERDMD